MTLFVFFNEQTDVSSWHTILEGLEKNPHHAYVAVERNDAGPTTAVSYRWDDFAFDYAKIEDWDAALEQVQSTKSFKLKDHAHTRQLVPFVQQYNKVWVDQHCIPQVEGKMGCVRVSASLYHGPVVAAFLTKERVDEAFGAGAAHQLLGRLETYMGRGWVQQEITARGKLQNLDAFEYFLEKAKQSGDERLESGGESLCKLLRRMKGEAEEPFADRVVRFYAVMEADFTFEEDREINVPSFDDVGYKAFPIGQQPDGWVLQPEISVHGERVAMQDSNGTRIAKWFRRSALYTQG